MSLPEPGPIEGPSPWTTASPQPQLSLGKTLSGELQAAAQESAAAQTSGRGVHVEPSWHTDISATDLAYLSNNTRGLGRRKNSSSVLACSTVDVGDALEHYQSPTYSRVPSPRLGSPRHSTTPRHTASPTRPRTPLGAGEHGTATGVATRRSTHALQNHWRAGPMRREPLSPVDALLNQYHVHSQLPLTLHLRTQRQIAQLREYQQLKESLQSAQAVMLADLGTVQTDDPPSLLDQTASGSRAGLLQQADKAALAGKGAAPIKRFNGSKILQEGVYVNGDYSFAAAPPMRGQPTANLLYERYMGHDENMPAIQRFYLRPDRAPRPRSPPLVSYPPRQAPQTGRRLPNGVPVCRLHSAQKTRRVTRQDDTHRHGHDPAACPDPNSHPHLVLPAGKGDLNQAMESALHALSEAEAHAAASAASKLLTPREGESEVTAVLSNLGAASSLGASTAEPLLDDPFAGLVKAHFNEMALQQSRRLQRKLNADLPIVLQAMGISSAALTTR